MTKSRVEEDGCNGGRDAQRRDAPSHPVDTLQAIRQRRQWTERSERRHDLRFCKIMLEHTGSRTSEMYMPEPKMNRVRKKREPVLCVAMTLWMGGGSNRTTLIALAEISTHRPSRRAASRLLLFIYRPSLCPVFVRIALSRALCPIYFTKSHAQSSQFTEMLDI